MKSSSSICKIQKLNDKGYTERDGKASPILFLNPVFKKMIWGGRRLKDQFNCDAPEDKIGECWAVSAHPHGDCTIREGIYRGWSLSQLWNEHPELFGYPAQDRFPLLVKIIDAKEDLSIQVHPNDVYAREHENGSFGKAECWYILDCPDDASLVIGHNADSREELEEMIHQGKWSEMFHEIPVKKGDFIQIDPGTIHTIKGGIMILEIQQSSDITYRLYDYDRLIDGKPRQLHIKQGIDVITVPAPAPEKNMKSAVNLPKNVMNELISCDYYTVWKLEVDKPVSFDKKYPFLIMSVIEGKGLINGQMIGKGDHFILPDESGKINMQGDMQIIISSVK